ncbi:MAG: hypothetical protein V3V61_01065 [Gammaproteobacteria bacterium]
MKKMIGDLHDRGISYSELSKKSGIDKTTLCRVQNDVRHNIMHYAYVKLSFLHDQIVNNNVPFDDIVGIDVKDGKSATGELQITMKLKKSGGRRGQSNRRQ